jgi:hypothetical protein
MLLKDKVCIITGAACGVGRAFCETLLKQGSFVNYFSILKKFFFFFSFPESEKFINCLSTSNRFQFSTWIAILVNCAALNYNSNLAKIELFSAMLT